MDVHPKQIVLNTLNISYPQNSWLHSYSKSNGKPDTRVCCSIFSLYIFVGKEKTAFKEVKAIKIALTSLPHRLNTFQKSVFLVDFKLVIQPITNNDTL